jgi:hypothetical protein
MHHKIKKNQYQHIKLLRSLIATAFIASGLFPLAPVLADGTTAGTSISNTATAEYDNPDGGKINATSNTVIVTVAEVTGINAVPDGITDSTGGTPQVGDVLTYNFRVTNVGNDPTLFNIPTAVTLTGTGVAGATLGTIQYSVDGGQNWISSATTPVTANAVPVYNPTQFIAGAPTVPVGTILVRVPVTINSNAAPGQTINVRLGNTPDPDTQNQPSSVSTATEELSTRDLDDSVTTDVDGPPLGGEKEASANQTATIGAKNYALATLRKTSALTTNTNPSTISDDRVTYSLSVTVEGPTVDPTGNNITPSALQGTAITVNNVTETRILISDAIPQGTELDAVPTAPTNWEAVYTLDPLTIDAKTANWIRFSGTVPAGIKRIGFINRDTLPNSQSLLADGTALTGFQVVVKVVSPTPAAPLTIANIAQLFGTTVGNNAPVYEESGDDRPSNYNDNNTPPTGTDTNGDGVPNQFPATIDDGFVDTPGSPETETEGTTNGNNGTGPNGEANVIVLSTSALLNGPNGNAGALGPTDNNNTDFTNKSSAIPVGTAPGSLIDPAVVTFTNTVQNTGSSVANISLLPTPPATAGDLPNGTTVTITSGANSATYTYNSGVFTFTNGTGTVQGNPISATNPVRIDALAANGTANYDVIVDLPPNTQLSTDIERGYPVPITAFVDTNGNGSVDGTEPQNITIDRVYTGFLKLVKLSQIIRDTGPAVGVGQDLFSTTPSYTNPVTGTVIDPDPSTSAAQEVPRTPGPGNIIVYQIQYKNISEPATNAAGSVILNVSGLVITENGTGPNGNWALDQDSNGIIDTSNVVGTAADSGANAEITYFNGPTGAISATDQTDVTKYVNTIGVQIGPGEAVRTFTFQRKVN